MISFRNIWSSIERKAVRWSNEDASRLPLLLSFSLISLTLVTLILSGQESISVYIRSHQGIKKDLILLLSPFLHSGFDHLVQNLFFLIPLAVSYNRHRDGLAFISSVYLIGILTNTIGPLSFVLAGVTSGLSVGISGVTHALSSRETLYYIANNISTKTDVVFFCMSAILFLWNSWILFSGSTPEGASISGHLTGLLLGVPWAAIEIYQNKSKS